VLARAPYRLATGKHQQLTMSLSRTARKLLSSAAQHRLSTRAIAKQKGLQDTSRTITLQSQV
jgi:hypothetical protein